MEKEITLKKTVLYDKHLEQNAKIVPFAGFEMPVQYKSIIVEHNEVRNNVGMFDVSHMGEFFVEGLEAAEFLNSLVPQNISEMAVSKAVYCQLLNENGGLIDDFITYRLEENKFLLIVNASRINEDWTWIFEKSKKFDVKLENKSDEYSLISLQGENAEKVMKEIGFGDLPSFFTIKKTGDLFLIRGGYTGEDGFEILMKNELAIPFWEKLLSKGVCPIGLGARDTLRLEAGLHLYGNDLDETTTPVEAGLSWSIDKNKKNDYTAKKIIEKQLKEGVKRKLIGFVMKDKAIARHGDKIYFASNATGEVTSGSYSPTLKQNIGLGCIDTCHDLKVGDNIQIIIRDKFYDAQIVKRPFVQKKYKR